MCGIFGFSLGRNLLSTETNSVKNDIKKFVKLSITRGTDAFGININYDENNYIYKSNSNPKIAIKRKEYNKFIDEKLKLASIKKNFFNYFGQT
jgi:asparagine synthetase B (glutamine-hydrolysing)